MCQLDQIILQKSLCRSLYNVYLRVKKSRGGTNGYTEDYMLDQKQKAVDVDMGILWK